MYLDRGKSSTLSAEETKRYGDTLLDLVSDSEQTWSNIVPACCLIRFYNFRPLDLPDTAKICIRAIIRDVVELDHEAGAKTKQANEEDGDQMKTDKESTQGNSDESNDSDDYYDSDSDNPTEVERPASLVVCSGCDRDLTLARDILHTCIDCGGRRQFDDHCWNLLARGELNLEDKGLVCRREHSFMVLTMWDEDIAKRWTPEFVPGVDEENILLDDWKRELKQTYGCLSDEAPQFL